MPIEYEPDKRIKIEFSIAIGLCRRDLQLHERPPTAREFSKWSHTQPEIFPKGFSVKQAQYMLAHPTELFA